MIFLFGQPTLFAPVWDELLQQCLRTHPGARVSICFRTQCFLGEQLLLAARYFCADLSYCVPTEGFEDLARAAILRVCNSRAPALFVSYDRQLNQSCIDNGWLDGIADIDSPPDELLLVTSAGAAPRRVSSRQRTPTRARARVRARCTRHRHNCMAQRRTCCRHAAVCLPSMSWTSARRLYPQRAPRRLSSHRQRGSSFPMAAEDCTRYFEALR